MNAGEFVAAKPFDAIISDCYPKSCMCELSHGIDLGSVFISNENYKSHSASVYSFAKDTMRIVFFFQL